MVISFTWTFGMLPSPFFNVEDPLLRTKLCQIEHQLGRWSKPLFKRRFPPVPDRRLPLLLGHVFVLEGIEASHGGSPFCPPQERRSLVPVFLSIR
jgi:hypothetical protein